MLLAILKSMGMPTEASLAATHAARHRSLVMPFNVPYRPRTPAKDFEETRRRYPHWPHVLAEGDSWFAHPIQWNILFQMQDLGGYAIRRLASIGDVLGDMVRESADHTPQYVRQLKRKRFRWRYLLFSGGGNDLLVFCPMYSLHN